jgi:hypothetical protein
MTEPAQRQLFAGLALAASLVSSVPVLADPLTEPVVGPKLICFKYSTFALVDGERIVDFRGDMEGMAIKIASPGGAYEVAESEIVGWARGANRLVFSRKRTRVYRVAGRERRYAIYGPTDFSDGKNLLLIRLSGVALRGTVRDAGIYQRFEVRAPSELKCDAKFTYSWGFLGPRPSAESGE